MSRFKIQLLSRIFLALIIASFGFAAGASQKKAIKAKKNTTAKVKQPSAPPAPVAMREFKGVKMPEEVTIDGHQLVLNGMGMRFVTKFGFDINVYVGALYLEKKSQDSDAILKSDGIKRLVMHFVRGVDRGPLLDGFSEGYENGCFVACDKEKDQFSQFAPSVVEVRKDNEYTFTFYKDKVTIVTNGPYGNTRTINDGAISRNLLSIFINKKAPPGQKFRKGLLGIPD